jgi:isoleucyl-tRNA synthetase
MVKALTTMTRVIAPILPHLAEEIHEFRAGETLSPPSVFMSPWTRLVRLALSPPRHPSADFYHLYTLGLRVGGFDC